VNPLGNIVYMIYHCVYIFKNIQEIKHSSQAKMSFDMKIIIIWHDHNVHFQDGKSKPETT
jgi:hypothetical protein